MMVEGRHVRDLIVRHGHPATLYLSADDYMAAASAFGRRDADADGPFVWCLATKVRMKNGGHVVDLSNESVFAKDAG